MRHHDWPQRLADYLMECRARPFEYGTHDCCRFAAGVVDAIADAGIVARMDAEHPYADREGAYAVIGSVGGLEQLVSVYLGEPVHPSRAGRGDVVLAELDQGETIGVCLGNECVFAAEPGGLAVRPRTVARVAWRVG
jgi:hypothetical protein